MVFGEKISKMGSVVNILFLTNLFLVVLVVPPSSCRHFHHNTTVEEGGTKKDIVTPLVTFAGSIASTYLQKWMLKDEAALASIINLSGKNFIAEGCDGENAEVPDPPNNLKRKGGSTEVEAYREGTVGNGIKKLTDMVKEKTATDYSSNLWIRCTFKTPISLATPVPISQTAYPDKKRNRDTARIIFLMSLRTNSDVALSPSRFAIAICTDRAQTAAENCAAYQTLKQMKALVEPWEPLTKKVVKSAKFEKVEGQTLHPIYLCNQADGVKLCVSAMMGNGGKAVAQIYVHDWTAGFLPDDDIPK